MRVTCPTHLILLDLETLMRGCIQKFPDWVDNEINNNNNNKHSLRSNTKGYGGETHWTDSQNSDTTAPSDRELYHLKFPLQADSPETSGYTLVIFHVAYKLWSSSSCSLLQSPAISPL
jgi:hypothetical protein